MLVVVTHPSTVPPAGIAGTPNALGLNRNQRYPLEFADTGRSNASHGYDRRVIDPEDGSTTGGQRQAAGPTGDGREPRRRPEETAERRLTWWQRLVRWVSWSSFLGVAVWSSATSDSVYFSPLEWLTLITAIAISIWCMARPLGGPKLEITEPRHLFGAFASRTSWGLVLFGTVLTVGGVAAAGAAVYDVATGRATVGDVVRDIAVFVEGWFAELIVRVYDAELENTRAYALAFLLLPGLLLLWFNLIPFLRRGTEFLVEADGSVSVRRGDTWEPLLEYQYATATADGTTIVFTPPPDGPPAVTLPQYRVFSREYGGRLDSDVSAEFFRRLLAGRGFAIDGPPTGKGFTARRT